MPYFAKALQWVFHVIAAVSVQNLLAKQAKHRFVELVYTKK